jgi:hypothetical protein
VVSSKDPFQENVPGRSAPVGWKDPVPVAPSNAPDPEMIVYIPAKDASRAKVAVIESPFSKV